MLQSIKGLSTCNTSSHIYRHCVACDLQFYKDMFFMKWEATEFLLDFLLEIENTSHFRRFAAKKGQNVKEKNENIIYLFLFILMMRSKKEIISNKKSAGKHVYLRTMYPWDPLSIYLTSSANSMFCSGFST